MHASRLLLSIALTGLFGCPGEEAEDAGVPDTGFADAAPTDTGPGDTGAVDSGPTDAGEDETDPTVSITTPNDQAVLTGIVSVSASATDNVGVDRVVFRLGTTEIGTVSQTPYSIQFDTTTFADGAHTLVAEAFDAAGNNASDTISVTVDNQGILPPDPATIATPLDPTVATNAALDVDFLFDGANPPQTGVDPGDIDRDRLAVLRGRVLNQDGDPLPGAIVRIKDHPELGQTKSRIDGLYDLAVNGGDLLTLSFYKQDFLPAHRKVETTWGLFIPVPDVYLIPLDTNVVTVDLTAPDPFFVARGSVVTDADGTRQSTLLIPAGRSASLVMADDSRLPITTLSIRSTEYSVGPNGPQKMPGRLPGTSGYTYAVEISVDEALAAGAKSVAFDQPVYSYTENFLGFPVGTPIPSAGYDRTTACWVPSDNGVVIEIVSITGGLADLDVTGDGAADTGTALTDLGITDAEREQLATLYTAGTELWRVPLLNFSPHDFNWPYGPPAGARGPGQPAPGDLTYRDKCPPKEGSIIEIPNQVLGQSHRIPGTDLSLNYRSNRVPGWKPSFRIPISSGSLPPNLKRIDVRVAVAGRGFNQSYTPTADLFHSFTWDGTDIYGRQTQGTQSVDVAIGYAYDATYQGFNAAGRAFAQYGGAQLSVNAREEYVFTQRHRGMLVDSTWDARGLGLGGWSLSVHHAYDPTGRVLYRGDGRTRAAANVNAIIETLPMWDLAGYRDPSGPLYGTAPSAVPADIHFAPDGTIYVADDSRYTNSIIRIKYDGTDYIEERIAGGNFCDSGDIDCLEETEGLAVDALLHHPAAITVGPNGNIFFADTLNHRIRRIDPLGNIETIVGSATTSETGDSGGGFGGDEGPAVDAELDAPAGLAVGKDCTIYVADTNNDRIRRVSCDGIIRTIAGGVHTGLGDGGPAKEAELDSPQGILLAPDGTLYIADSGHNRIRAITPDGMINTIAGDGLADFTGDGGPAIAASLNQPRNIDLGPDGSLYIADTQNERIRRVSPDGIITTIAGTGSSGMDGDNGPAASAELSEPFAMVVGHDRGVYVADHGNRRIRRIAPPFGGIDQGQNLIIARDGTEYYVFDPEGRHLSTHRMLTSATLYQFQYDAEGQLEQIQDGEGKTTVIERDTAGLPTAIVGPFSQRTTLATNSDGFLAGITDPASRSIGFTYDAQGTGLLEQLTDANAQTSQYTYNAAGRLIRNEDPAGGSNDLTRIPIPGGQEITMTSREGRTSTFRLARTPEGGFLLSTIDTAGRTSETMEEGDTEEMLHASGLMILARVGPDPRWGMQAPLMTELDISTPGGLSQLRTHTRTVWLTDHEDPLSLETLVDLFTINGNAHEASYDVATKTISMRSAEGRTQTVELDDQGRMVRHEITGRAARTWTFDQHGRLSAIGRGTGATARVWTINYGTDGYVESIVNPLAETVQLVRDSAGRITQLNPLDGRVVDFTYDGKGNVTGILPVAGPAHSFTYDGVDRVATYSPPNVGAGTNDTLYTYDYDGNLTTVDRPDGTQVQQVWDDTGLLESITIPRGTITATYASTTGLLLGIGAPNSVDRTFTRDGPLVTEEAWTGLVNGTVSRTFNEDFRIASESVNGLNIVNFSYDNDILLVGAGAMTITRSATDGLVSATSLGSVSTSNGFNEFLELETRDVSYNTSALYNASYVRDALGRISDYTETVEGVSHSYSYSYDASGRLTGVSVDGVPTDAFTYDDRGNRLTHGADTGTYDDQDRVTQYAGRTYTYGANGELQSMTSGGQTTSYVYDELGALMEVTLPNATVISYDIDGDHRRVGKRRNGVLEQAFLYRDRLNPIAELDGNSLLVSRFVYGTRPNVPDFMVRAGATYRIISDHLGSVRLVVDSTTGTIEQRLDYDAFGNVTQDTNPGFQPFGFAGGLYDADSGLVRFGSRDYDPIVGRWTAKDRLGFAARDLNLYRYASGDPVNYIDPDGDFPFVAALVVAGAIAAGSKLYNWYKGQELAETELEEAEENAEMIEDAYEEGDYETLGAFSEQQMQDIFDARIYARQRCRYQAAQLGANFPGTTLTGTPQTGPEDMVGDLVKEPLSWDYGD